jgi:hypothetical protein
MNIDPRLEWYAVDKRQSGILLLTLYSTPLRDAMRTYLCSGSAQQLLRKSGAHPYMQSNECVSPWAVDSIADHLSETPS